MLALVCRLYANQLGIIYILVDKEGKTHLVASEEYLYRIRDKVANYTIERRKVKGKLNQAMYNAPDAVLAFSKLSFKTNYYFDLRDITLEANYARVGTLFAKGYDRKSVANYEYQKWCSEDKWYFGVRYKERKWLTDQAIEYLNQLGGDINGKRYI